MLFWSKVLAFTSFFPINSFEFALETISFANNDDSYFNKRDIEESISIGDYNLYIDYSKNIYLELKGGSMREYLAKK